MIGYSLILSVFFIWINSEAKQLCTSLRNCLSNSNISSFFKRRKRRQKRDWSFKLVWWFYTMEHSHFYYAHHQYVCLFPAYGQFPTNYLVFDNASKREVYGERIKSSGFLNVRIISIGFAKRYKNDWSFFMASSFKW